jgi:hypothetical protein
MQLMVEQSKILKVTHLENEEIREKQHKFNVILHQYKLMKLLLKEKDKVISQLQENHSNIFE